jgi:aspartate aminotransferase-like enzyme
VVVPGSGTFGMEAVARQFATDRKVMVLRNGWFSYRWTQIFDMGRIPSEQIVLKARQTEAGSQKPFAPVPVQEAVAAILEHKPAVVFAPQVETSAGMLLPDDYLKQIAAAVREVDGLFVVDAIAAGTLWVDMAALGIDIVVSAPQKGWSGSPCAGLVMLGERARARIDATTSTSYAADLKKWLQIMEAYESGGHAYHATLPTDGLVQLHQVMLETERFGFDRVKANQIEMGRQIRALLEARGFASVAAEGFQAPCVVVSYTTDPDIQSGRKFAAQGLQIAAGVPLQCDEPADFRTFRIGLFGLDKLQNVERTVASFKDALDHISG